MAPKTGIPKWVANLIGKWKHGFPKPAVCQPLRSFNFEPQACASFCFGGFLQDRKSRLQAARAAGGGGLGLFLMGCKLLTYLTHPGSCGGVFF